MEQVAAPRGAQGEGPKSGKLQESSFLGLKAVQTGFFCIHVDTFIYEEYRLFMAKPKMSPLVP